jgi:uncharacterized repeat protein (TIGR01451 family)
VNCEHLIILSTLFVAGHGFAAAKRPRVMRPLSEVFAPGAPTLPERLRTLVVSPERELEPGMTVRATFTFRNQGGAAATGVRLRFNVPEGLVYLVGSGRLDGSDLDDETGSSPLLARAGAHIGDVMPGEERRIEIGYSVAGAIENGTVVEVQAALASFELAPVGSNVVRLVVRSKPQLRNALSRITIEGEHQPIPGSRAEVTVRIHNAGQSSARDIVVVAPIPEHTTYLEGTARINGRELERDLGSTFDRAYAPIVAPALAANASATLTYRIRIDTPLRNGTQIVARAEIGSQETSAFALEPASLTIVSAPDFANDRTILVAEPARDVRPGEHVALALTAHNGGTSDAERLSASVELPDGLVAVRGGSTIDGRATRDRRKDALRFAFGRIGAGDEITLRIEAVVASPLENETILSPAATLEWESSPSESSRRLECAIEVRSEPAFPARHNFIERRGSEIVRPGDAIEATLLLSNDGSAAARDSVLHLRVRPALDEMSIVEGTVRLGFDREAVELGQLEPHSTRRLTIRARIPSPLADRSDVRIGASLHTRELGETPLREVFWRVDSHPSFRADSCRLELADDSVLRPNQLAEIDVILRNTGTDVAHNVALRVYISPEARLESVEGATREKSSLLFGDLAPEARVRARLGLRLLRSLAKEFPVTVDSVLTADAILPVPLARLTIATTAEPDFSVGSFYSDPSETVDVGETVEWTLQVRNGGDGVAHRAQVSIDQPASLIYVPNSTTVNGVPIRDVGALAPFAAETGIVFNEVDPGVEATVRWRTVVHNGLPTNTTITPVARICYDGERDDTIVSSDLTVRAAPVFANAIVGLPFGLDGVLGPALGGEQQRALLADRFLELPPATPVSEGNGAGPYVAQLPAGISTGDLPTGVTAGTLADFDAARMARTLRFLREATFGTLVTHLFVLRAFLPNAIGDARCGSLDSLHECLHEELDRLFIKLRLPRYIIASRDIETPSLRATVERVLHEAAGARGVPAPSPHAALELRGSFRPSTMAEIAERLTSYELANALPWSALAQFLPDETPVQAQYRAQLLESLDRFADGDAADFLEALQNHREAALDGALEAFLEPLRVVAER